MKILFSPKRIFIIITSLVKSFTFHETTNCYILEHLNITRLSKRCNDKKIFLNIQFLVKIQKKIHNII